MNKLFELLTKSEKEFLKYLRKALPINYSQGGSVYPNSIQKPKVNTFYSDFLSSSPFDSFWSSTISSSGTFTLSNGITEGVAVLSTNTNAAGRSYCTSGQNIFRGQVGIINKTKASIDWSTALTAADNTNTGEAIFGYMNNISTDSTHVAAFILTMGLTDVTFVARTRGGGSTNNTPLTLPTSGVFNTYEVIMNEDKEVIFYINGIEVAKHTTQLPNTSTGCNQGLGIRKTAGIVARQIQCDWIASEQKIL